MRSRETRMERMSKQLMRDFADIIRNDLKLPESFKLISITHVKLAPDQSAVKVFISHLKEGETKPSAEALNTRAYEIRERLMKRLDWRKIPMVSFYEDDSLKRGFDLIQKIDRLGVQPTLGQDGSVEEPHDLPN